MSTLKTNTLSNVAGTASTAIENAIHGSAKAWVNFNGTGTVAIRAQYNVSSITDNGTGDYTVNFTNAMADANYSVVLTGDVKAAATFPNISGGWIATLSRNAVPTASSVRFETLSTAALLDTWQVNVAIFR